ncbi:BatD family protein [Silvimonas amylolytica]|uniref:Oxygen tolerance n=1 Tax=Silvimonas amylolytica TaxID=449663 RepID=A0ABQ2PI35_9NEIS|nr:BatD family protein [Silvimonas amylolytica]GGP25046.1 hypothetical protein GCM10010971_08650 [Silvimonas amylolytica]
MTAWIRVLFVVMSLLLAGASWADAARSMARVHLEPAGPVQPGQPVKLVVDALTTTWFTGAPVYPPIDVPGAIVSPPSDTADNLNVDINGARWFGVSRNYMITAQAGGDLHIPAIALQLQVGQAGKVTVHTAPIVLKVKAVERPAGAENAIGTSRLQVSQQISRSLTGLKQGDAITRTITISADGVQGMMLPPTPFSPVEGLSVYPRQGQIKDITKDRQGFVGSTRQDAATYVIQKAGSYTLPAVSIAWWDTRAGQLRTAVAPAVTFSAVATPSYHPEVGLPPEASAPAPARIRHLDLQQLAEYAGACMVALVALWLLGPRLWRASRSWHLQTRKPDPERTARRDLRRALASKNPRRIIPALYRWLDTSPGVAPAELRRGVDTATADGLLQSVYGQGKHAPESGFSLAELRKHQAIAPASSASALPPLN